MRRGNRHLVGVVMGGRSGGSRDATMRSLLAENLEKAATQRTVAAITERNASDANADVAEAEAESRPTRTVQAQGAVQVASASEPAAAPPVRPAAPATRSVIAQAAAAVPPAQAKPEPAPLTSGVIQTQSIAVIPGSSEPMKPVKVKTVQVKAGQMKLASAGSAQPVTAITNAIPPARPEVPETSSAVVAKAETNKAETNRAEANRAETNRVEAARMEMPPQPANHGTGNGLLGVLPASSVPPSPTPQAMAYADPAPRAQPQPQLQIVQQNGAIKPAAIHTGWIVQVGALESESEARERIEAARNQARGLLAKADPFTEPVVAKGDRKLFRARFAGLDRDQAEAVCRTLKRSDISCIAVRN
jgi:D-alanyl-D-alanine carboxypeptidase